MDDYLLDFIDAMSDPLFLLDGEGKTRVVNKSAKYILGVWKENNVEDFIDTKKIIDECEEVNPKISVIHRNIYIDKLDYELKTYIKRVIGWGETKYILYFGETIYSSNSIKNVINSIDDMVVIFNKNGTLLSYNESTEEMVYENLGIDMVTMRGKNISALRDKGIAESLITDEVIKKKKKVTKNVCYINGKTIMYTGRPIFNKEKEISHIVLTGRDISNLLELYKTLEESEKNNERYLKELQELKNSKPDIIYSSKAMESLIKIAKRVAKTDSSVFIRGSSGVGKEEIAKYIHKNSKRSDKAFIAVNCAAIPSELLEMEFFGYEEGSFTGAKKGGKLGLLEVAKGGTIFLDEIGELPLQMQSKLLRAIQESGFMRVGGSEFIETDVRYISATNITEEDLFNGVKFRQDLYYRISVVPINIPDIKDRKEDIIPLTSHFINVFNKKYERKVKVTKEAIKLFLEYDWPGNVREIKNIMERLIILVEDEYIQEEDFKLAVNLDFKKGKIKSMIVNGKMTLNEAHDLLDEIIIEKSIREEGSIARAAKSLDVDPSTIHRKIKRLKK